MILYLRFEQKDNFNLNRWAGRFHGLTVKGNTNTFE